jgi:hypothetical protein
VSAPGVFAPRAAAVTGALLLAGQVAMVALAPALAVEGRVAWGPALAFVALAMAAGGVWLRALPAAGGLPFAVWFALGLAMRLVWFAAPPVLNTDWLRYLWDGALVARGLWPWGPPPAAGVPEALGPAGPALRETLPFAHLRTIYPGTAQLGFGLAHLVAPFDLFGLRVVMLAGELATLALMAALLVRLGAPPARAAVWWCCPILPVLFIGNAHVEAVLVPLLLGAVLATLAGRGMAAGALLGLAAGVKVWPLLLAPLLGRALPRAALVPAALALALAASVTVLPLLASARHPDAGLTAYAGQWLVNNAPFAWARDALALLADRPEAVLRPLVAAAAVGVALAVARHRPATPDALLRGALIVAAAAFYLSPAQYPWYAAWFLPFAALLGFRPLLLPAALLPLYWLWFPMDQAGLSGVFNRSIAALHALPVALALALRWR